MHACECMHACVFDFCGVKISDAVHLLVSFISAFIFSPAVIQWPTLLSILKALKLIASAAAFVT